MNNKRPFMVRTDNNIRIGIFFFLLSVLFFRISIDYAFSSIIVKYFGYQGFVKNDNALNMIISYVVLMVFSCYAYRYKDNENSIGREVLYILFLLSFIPFTTMIGYGNLTVSFTTCNILFWFFLFTYYSIQESINRHFSIKLPELDLSKKKKDLLIYAFLFLSCFVIVYISGRYTGFRINLSLLDVYSLRSEARMYNVPTILKYLFGWTRALNTIFIAYFFRRKRYFLMAFVFMLQIMSFGIDGSKTVFFNALCALIINILPRFSLKKINQYALYALILLTMLGMLIYKITGNIYISGIFTRRLLVLPVQLGQHYFDFFTKNMPDYYRGSFLKHFGFQTPYPDLVYLIGSMYYNSPNMGANNGLISDAITNMGYIGIFIEPFLISWMLRALERSSKGLDLRIYITIALYTSIVILNSFLPVVFITHGILILIIILKIMKRETN